ncbi:hypothetical protein TEA_006858 [Camellia sinensis var. sinensis]|uniref:Acyl-[acyl-carrier-protein] desaturase n=1 Tax=Camellia sinensis var. sinensis TaxID=542762 RepID=A0A4S4ELH0_CAMSN|nr:hypothetical protein TEA_006858 [Camellia sinensis var. sinensis]
MESYFDLMDVPYIEGTIKGRNSTRHAVFRPRAKNVGEFLPDPTSDGFYDQVEELRQRAKELPDEYLVVLVGDMITEEALPTYQTTLNNHDAIQDETGSSMIPGAVWIRGWTAEENRHGDLLSKYLSLSGRVDMRQVEKTIQYLIGSGMKKMSKPAHHMYDGEDDDLFVHFSKVAQRLRVYTAKDNADTLEFLVEKWGMEKLVGLSVNVKFLVFFALLAAAASPWPPASTEDAPFWRTIQAVSSSAPPKSSPGAQSKPPSGVLSYLLPSSFSTTS